MSDVATLSSQIAPAPAPVPVRTQLPARQRILNAAVTLFAEKGFNGTTTRTIARAANVNEALIFRHFPTKQDLYVAIIQEKIEHQSRRNLVDAAAATDPDDAAVFRRIALGMFETVEADPEFLRLLYFSALEGHELSKLFFDSYVQRLQTLLQERVRSGTDSGRFRQIDPYLAARAFLGMFANYLLSA